MSNHIVKLTQEQKIDWFKSRIEERLSVKNIESEQELVDLVRDLRKSFKSLYQRDVPGSFITQLLNDLGVAREHSDGVKKKRMFMFSLMDINSNFRDNKTQCRKAVEAEFSEKILGIVFDSLWEEWHSQGNHPDATSNVDIHGQQPLF